MSDQELDESRIGSVLENYTVGRAADILRIPTGLIHRTWRISGAAGTHILQLLHPDLSAEALLRDYAAVTDALAERGFPAPRLVRTRSGSFSVERPEGRYRLITFLDGSVYECVLEVWMAEEAARMLGLFHQTLCEFRHEFQHSRPLHDSPAHLEAFRAALKAHRDSPIAGQVEDLARRIDAELPKHLLPRPLPGRIVHGDPKINNILFDPGSKTATGMVDLDSCARHTVLVDLGDAVRSWCRSGPEHEATSFLIDRFAAVMEGYRRSGASISSVEKNHLVRACLLIPLELASRFVRDAFEDRYFGWNPDLFPSRPAHNLARASGMVALYDSMSAQRSEMEDQVNKIWGP